MSGTASTALIVAGIILAFVVVVVTAALVEVFRQLADLRAAVNPDDQPVPLDLADKRLHASDLELPAALAALPEAILVFLSTKCAVCRSIAYAFRGGSPESVWFVVYGAEEARADLVATLDASANRVIVDAEGEIPRRLRLNIRPSVFTVKYGEITRAAAVSSPRQVLSLVPVVSPIAWGASETNGRSEGRSRRPSSVTANREGISGA